MLTVHHLNNSRSQRVLWLLEELEVDYEIARYERDPKTMLAPKKLRDIHPLGKAPVVTDGDHTIAESGAIIEYVVDAYGEGRLKPDAGTPEFLKYRYWMHYAEGSAMSPFLLHVIFDQLPKQAPWVARPLLKMVSKTVNDEYIQGQIELHTSYWEEELENRPYFAGDDFTAADIQMSFPLESAAARGATESDYPNIFAMLDKLHDRPAYGRALERGGDYSLAM